MWLHLALGVWLDGPREAWPGAGGHERVSWRSTRCSLASSGCLCLHLGPSPNCLPQPPLPLLCLPGEASGPWALRTQTGHKAGTPLGRAPCVQGHGSPQAGPGTPRPQGLLLDAGPPASPCGAAGLRSSLGVGTPQIPGGGLRQGPWPDPHTPSPLCPPNMRWAACAGQGSQVRNHQSVVGVLCNAHIPAVPSALGPPRWGSDVCVLGEDLVGGGRGREAAVCLEPALSRLSRMWPWSWEPPRLPCPGHPGRSCRSWGPNAGAELAQSPHRRHSDPREALPGVRSPDWLAGTMSPGGGRLPRERACSVPCSTSVGCLCAPRPQGPPMGKEVGVGGKRPRRRGRRRHGVGVCPLEAKDPHGLP